MTMTENSTAAALRRLLGERLLLSSDATFAATESVVFAGPSRHPAMIARPRSSAEVADIITVTTAGGLPLVVRGGGHSYTRRASLDGGIVLDTRLMDRVRIDSANGTGVVQSGVTAGQYTALAGEQGLATGFGDTPSVGVAGLTLGGGIGYLSRRDGLTIDNLLGAEVVLADGSIVNASADEHPDLFWALRGGGGNFGVVTELRFRLTRTPVVTGGMIAFPARPGTVRALVEAGIAAPDTVSSMVNVMKAPPAPFLPAELHGTPIVIAFVCHSGDPDAAAELAPFRAAGTAIVDLVRSQPYPGMFSAAPDHTDLHAELRSGFIDGVDETWAAAAIDLLGAASTSGAVVNLRMMGGAIARVPADETAFAHRDRAVAATVGALHPSALEEMKGWADDGHRLLNLGGSAYVNFLSEASPEAVRRAYPTPTLARLAAVKRAYDPQSVFQAALPIDVALVTPGRSPGSRRR